MPRISTGTGDRGDTGLVGGGRVPKTDPRVEAYGAVDELNDVLGLAAAFGDDALREQVQAIQEELFTVGSDLATPPDKDGVRVTDAMVERLEAEANRLEAELPPLNRFILPGGTKAAAFLHQARSVCRRAERRGWATAGETEAGARRPGGSRSEPSRSGGGVNERALVYLNRLSDLLFLMARAENVAAGVEETQWVGRGE